MFARVGRSGYVLKPELLRKKGTEKDKAALSRSEKFLLELEVSPCILAASETFIESEPYDRSFRLNSFLDPEVPLPQAPTREISNRLTHSWR